MLCLSCWKKNPDDAVFCIHCGEKLVLYEKESLPPQSQYGNPQQPGYYRQSVPQQVPEAWREPPRPARKRKAFGIIALILCACLLVVFVGSYFFKSDERMINERIDAFLDAYNSGNMQGVMECFDAKTRNKYQGMMGIGNALISGSSGFGFSISDMFGVGVGTMSEGDILTISDRSITIDSETTATVIGILSYKDKHAEMSDRAVITMVKEDGEWFIKDIEDK